MSRREHNQLPVIGRDIRWDEIHKHSPLVRATEFERLASIDGDKVKAMPPTMPYGILTVECLVVKSSFTLPITHRLDFLHVSHAYDLCENPKLRERLLQTRAESFNSRWGRDDYLKLYSRVWGRTRKMEVLVASAQFAEPQQQGIRTWGRKLFGANLPSLFVCVCAKGFLERAVCTGFGDVEGPEWAEMIQPLAEFKPQT